MTTRKLTAATLSLAIMAGASAPAQAEAQAETQNEQATYEFLKATEDRVWRLNRQTGEIAVCTLERDALLCSTSRGAAETPPTTYEELQQREAAELAAAAEKD
jgi:hypothetical protein